MREAVSPAGKRGTWLKQLSNDQLSEIFHRLKMGQSCHRIAQHAQEVWGIQPKASAKSLSRAVRQFKHRMLGDLELVATDEKSKDRRKEGRRLLERGRSQVAKLDGLDRMRWLIELQTDRLINMMEHEGMQGLPWLNSKAVNKTIETLQNMLDRYLKIQIDLGILDAKPQELQLTLKHRFDGLLQHTISPGTALTDWADKLLESAEKEALTFSLAEDGSYKLLGPGGEDARTEDAADGEGARSGDGDGKAA
jgi:hypothetical protein